MCSSDLAAGVDTVRLQHGLIVRQHDGHGGHGDGWGQSARFDVKEGVPSNVKRGGAGGHSPCVRKT